MRYQRKISRQEKGSKRREMILKMLHLNPDSAPRAVLIIEQVIWVMMEYNLNNNDKLTLLDISKFITDKEFRIKIMQSCNNEATKELFGENGSFNQVSEQQQLDYVMPILRTFAMLETKEAYSNIFNQAKSKVDFAK